MSDEIEIIKHPYIKFLNLFVVELTYRSPHFHHDYELLLVLSGSATLFCQGMSFIVEPSDMVLLNPNDTHEIRTSGENLTTLCMQFSPKFFENTYPTLKTLSFDEISLKNILSQEQLHTIRCLLLETSYQYMKRKPTWQLLSSSLLGLLVSTLLKQIPWHPYTHEEVHKNRLRRKRIENIIQYVEDNYASKILLADIAKKEGVSTGYLSHFIKDNLNQSFQEYVTSVRFRHALLFIRSNLSLLDICLETGFSNTRYLTNAFIKYQGCTPKEYLAMTDHLVESKAKAATAEHIYSPSETLTLLEQLRNKEDIYTTIVALLS